MASPMICELRGAMPGGGTALAHVVERASANTERSNRQRKLLPERTAQYQSWFMPRGGAVHEGYPVVAQIYFPFDDVQLDAASDRLVLDALIQHLRYDLSNNRRVVLDFVGSADSRGAAAYNEELARQRAQRVRDYVQLGLGRRTGVVKPHLLYYQSRVSSLGERFATGDHQADRRVDVVLRSEAAQQTVQFGDPIIISTAYRGPLTRKLQFKGYDSGSISLFRIIGSDYVEIEVRDPRLGKSAFYRYIGANVGTPSPIPASMGIPDTGYTDLELPVGYGWVDVEDFAGPGALQNIGGGKTGTLVSFFGPKLRFQDWSRQNGVAVFMDGWAVQFPGVSSGQGIWDRLPYNSAWERKRELSRRDERFRDRGPKY